MILLKQLCDIGANFMSIVKQFENITIQEFEEQYRDDVLNFELSERQQIYSSLPKSVLEDALNDENRVANIAINENGDVVGFFVLHQYYQHEGYDTPKQVIYVRSLSVNEDFQGFGYGTKMMMYLPWITLTLLAKPMLSLVDYSVAVKLTGKKCVMSHHPCTNNVLTWQQVSVLMMSEFR